jgi:hypothetical protein
VETEQVVETLEIVDTSSIIGETAEPQSETASIEADSIVAEADVEGEVLSDADVEEVIEEKPVQTDRPPEEPQKT